MLYVHGSEGNRYPFVCPEEGIGAFRTVREWDHWPVCGQKLTKNCPVPGVCNPPSPFPGECGTWQHATYCSGASKPPPLLILRPP